MRRAPPRAARRQVRLERAAPTRGSRSRAARPPRARRPPPAGESAAAPAVPPQTRGRGTGWRTRSRAELGFQGLVDGGVDQLRNIAPVARDFAHQAGAEI